MAPQRVVFGERLSTNITLVDWSRHLNESGRVEVDSNDSAQSLN